MRLRWEDEVEPWQPPTDMTAPGALFNAKPVREDWYQLYGHIGLLYSSGFISLQTARGMFLKPMSGV